MDDSQKVTFPERCVAERHCHSHGVVCHGSVNQENSILKVASEKQTLNICIKLFTDFCNFHAKGGTFAQHRSFGISFEITQVTFRVTHMHAGTHYLLFLFKCPSFLQFWPTPLKPNNSSKLCTSCLQPTTSRFWVTRYWLKITYFTYYPMSIWYLIWGDFWYEFRQDLWRQKTKSPWDIYMDLFAWSYV